MHLEGIFEAFGGHIYMWLLEGRGSSPSSPPLDARLIIVAKCPFVLRDDGIIASDKLPYLDEQGLLKPSHSYYHQICVACGVNNIKRAIFIIWTPFGSKIQEIEFDSLLYEKIKSDAKYYYYNYYLKSQKIY